MKFRVIILIAVFLFAFPMKITYADVPSQVGVASWYGMKWHGERTASGRIFNMNRQTAAHKSLPFGTKVRVVNLKNSKETTVTITDRGPYYGRRLIDLSYAAAKAIGMVSKGTAKVRIEVVKRP